MGCNQSTQRKQETATADSKPQQVEAQPAKPEAVEVLATNEQHAVTDVVIASPMRPASPTKIDASHADLEPSLDHVAAEGPSEVPSQTATPRELGDAKEMEHEVPVNAEPTEVVAVVAVTETAVVESSPPAESVQTEPTQLEVVASAEAKQMPSPVAVPILPIPAVQQAKPANRSKTPVKRSTTAASSKTPSKSPAKQATGVQSKTPNGKIARKVQFDKVPAQNPQEQRKLRAKKSAGRNQSNVNEEMFLASVAAFERQLTHRGNLDKQLGTR